MKKLFLLPLMAMAPLAMADRYHDDDADEVLAVSTAAVGGLFAATMLSETTEANEVEAYHRRMIKEARKYLRNMERYGEGFATQEAQDEFLERLAQERAENRNLSTSELVVQILKEEESALGN